MDTDFEFTYEKKGFSGSSPLEDGVYKVRLVSIERVIESNKFKLDENGQPVEEPRSVWTFDTVDEMRDDGKPYRFWKRTGFSYGNDKANLTLLLDQMLGRRLTTEEFEDFDRKTLIDKVYNGMVECYTGADGVQRNRLVKVKLPAAAKGGKLKPVAPAKPDDLLGPEADALFEDQ